MLSRNSKNHVAFVYGIYVNKQTEQNKNIDTEDGQASGGRKRAKGAARPATGRHRAQRPRGPPDDALRPKLTDAINRHRFDKRFIKEKLTAKTLVLASLVS